LNVNHSFIDLFYLDIVVNFNQEMYVVDEDNGLAQLELIFTNPSSFDITIQVMATDVTAVGVNNTDCVIISSENDYTIGLYNVTFPANVTSRIIDIPICDDIVLEEDEEFDVSIISNSLPDNIINGNVDQSTVIIVDNDGEYYGSEQKINIS